MQRSICFLKPIILAFSVVFLVSCAPIANQISLHYDDQVEADLTGGRLQSGFQYYYSGPEAKPHTIIGVSEDVSFQQDLWQPAREGNEQVQKWLENIDNRHRNITDMYSGGRLRDEQGREVGIWFSKYRFFSGVLSSEGELVIRRPLRDKKGMILQRERK